MSRLIGNLLVIAAIAATAAIAFAEEPAVSPRVDLPDVTSFEISEDGTVGAQAFGGRLRVPGRTLVTRRVPDLWKLRLPDGERPEDLTVSYELTDMTGRLGYLGHALFPNEQIPVRLRPLPPRIVGEEDDAVLVEGGIILELSLAAARRAGTYRGILTVTIHRL